MSNLGSGVTPTLTLPEQGLALDQAPTPVDGGEVRGGGGSQLRIILRTFTQNKLAVIGSVLVLGLLLFSFVGPLLYHTNQSMPNLVNVKLGPGAGRPLGTDEQGFDVLGRLMSGGQITLEVAFAVAFITTAVGTIWGSVAGYFGGFLDNTMMRFVDVLLSIPIIYFYLDLEQSFHTSEWTLIILLSGLSWLGPSRLVRGETLSLRSREYVQAVVVMGGKPSRIIFRHLVPNAIGTIVVQATFLIADAIFFLTILQYLGLGLPSGTPTWGNLIDEGQQDLQAGLWWELYPALILIVIAIVAFSFIGDALRDALDVRLQER